MFQAGEYASLGMEALNLAHGFVTQELERCSLFERAIGPRRRIDLTHAAATDQLMDAPRSKARTGGQRRLQRSGLLRMRRGIQNSRRIVRTQQFVDLAVKVWIIRAGAGQERFACRDRQRQCFGEQPFQKQPSFAMHGASPRGTPSCVSAPGNGFAIGTDAPAG